MTDETNNGSAEIQEILQRYMAFYSRQKWDEWIDLWTDDGVLEFPFAPPGRRSRYIGKLDILSYMKAVAVRMGGRIKSEGLDYYTLHPMQEPGKVCLEMSIKGHLVESGAPYQQKYISIIETKGGKISVFREYWNPMVSMDANGGREAWTAAFGSPETEAAAS